MISSESNSEVHMHQYADVRNSWKQRMLQVLFGHKAYFFGRTERHEMTNWQTKLYAVEIGLTRVFSKFQHNEKTSAPRTEGNGFNWSVNSLPSAGDYFSLTMEWCTPSHTKNTFSYWYDTNVRYISLRVTCEHNMKPSPFVHLLSMMLRANFPISRRPEGRS